METLRWLSIILVLGFGSSSEALGDDVERDA
jgi:hypothetical protein